MKVVVSCMKVTFVVEDVAYFLRLGFAAVFLCLALSYDTILVLLYFCKTDLAACIQQQ